MCRLQDRRNARAGIVQTRPRARTVGRARSVVGQSSTTTSSGGKPLKPTDE